MVEPQPSKLMARVRFPLPAPILDVLAHIAQLVEHTLGKGEVSSSNLLMSSISAARDSLSQLFYLCKCHLRLRRRSQWRRKSLNVTNPTLTWAPLVTLTTVKPH